MPDTDKTKKLPNLTKREIVIQISNETGMTQHEVFDILQRTLDCITESVAAGRNVELRKFGVFEVRLTKRRVGRNPKKPEDNYEIPPRATVKFKPGKVMKQRVEMLSDELVLAEESE